MKASKVTTAKTIDGWPILSTAGFSAAYAFGDHGLEVIHDHSQDDHAAQMVLSAACVAIWRLVARRFDIRHLVVKQNDWSCVVSGHGNLVFEGGSSVNLGLLLLSLSDFAFELPPVLDAPLDFGGREQNTIWRVIERLARSETPRRMQFQIGDDTIVIDAEAGRFGIASGASDLRELFDRVDAAARTGTTVRYTLDDASPGAARQQTIADVLVALGGTQEVAMRRWEVGPAGWPRVFPQEAEIDDLRMIMHLSSDNFKGGFEGSCVTMHGYGTARTLVLDGLIEKDGSVMLTTHT